jgi:hypothetical protein
MRWRRLSADDGWVERWVRVEELPRAHRPARGAWWLAVLIPVAAAAAVVVAILIEGR